MNRSLLLMLIAALLVSSLTLSACNTWRGFGTDISDTGDEMSSEDPND